MLLIKGMKMPKSCEECQVCDYEEGDCLLTGTYLIRGKNTLPHNGERRDWCPLVEVEEAEESDDCLTNFLIAVAKEREKDETIGEVKIGNYRVIGNRFSQVWRYEPEGDKE